MSKKGVSVVEQDKETMGQAVLRNLAPYQQKEGISDNELEVKVGLGQSYLSKLRLGTRKTMSYAAIAKLSAYFGILPETLTRGIEVDVPLPTSATYFERKYGITDPGMIAALETMAQDMVSAQTDEVRTPLTRKEQRELIELLRLWRSMDVAQRTTLLTVAQQFGREVKS